MRKFGASSLILLIVSFLAMPVLHAQSHGAAGQADQLLAQHDAEHDAGHHASGEHADDHGHADGHSGDHGDAAAHTADHADHGEAHASESGAHHNGAMDPCAHHGDAHGGHGGDHGDDHADEHGDDHAAEGEGYNPTPMILHHIADANEWEIWHGATIPLPCIAFVKGEGLKVFMSSKLNHGHRAYDGFIMNHGRLMRVEEEGFPSGKVDLDNGGHFLMDEETGKAYLCYEGQAFTAGRHDLIRDGFAYPWFDFSITKNVATVFLIAIIMLWIFLAVAAAYRRRAGLEPRGLQAFMEPLFTFVRDDIAEPNLGKDADRFLPYLMTVFFFIWIGNMLGQLPFISNPNLTGNITVTMALALITFFLTNLNGTKTYWNHLLTAPGTPFFVKPILVPLEIFGLFTKPFALMVRLFANISAGHIIVLSLTALVFVFGNLGESVPGSLTGAAIAIPFTLFMGLIELLVAFLQAFIFTMLSALFIGMALEEHH